ncbi:pyridoxamine 5'-phosphate oxidase family protein [Streptomyces sp. NPDC049040]|uniref:pyridoxamine 5'-phosphate oxidase family protein n=1 Tax=Streptomyces sp. NPDC049040 TaxID=3365593 RepID=UPI003718BB8E
MSTRMTVEEREAFLADLHIGVLSIADADGRGPVQVPIGYDYAPGGDIRVCTKASSRKLQLARAAGRVTFLVQSEVFPYQYVSVEGPIVLEEQTDPEEHRARSIRYLGEEMGQGYFDAIKPTIADMVTLAIRPERWRTYDASKGM